MSHSASEWGPENATLNNPTAPGDSEWGTANASLFPLSESDWGTANATLGQPRYHEWRFLTESGTVNAALTTL